MSIVFDEVTGSVEPSDTSAAREEAPPAPQGGEAGGAPDEATLERWLRRRTWLEARRLAD